MKRIIQTLDWPSSVSTTRALPSTEELTTFIRSSHTDESHGKRKGFQREGIPNASVHHEITSSQNTTSTHTRKIVSRHVSIHLPDNSIVLPSDPIRESEFSLPNYQNTQPITRKLLVHPHTDLLCVVDCTLILNNKAVVRLYYSSRRGKPTSYIIPPLFTLNKQLTGILIAHTRLNDKSLCTQSLDLNTEPRH